jgi:hypothetical protein
MPEKEYIISESLKQIILNYLLRCPMKEVEGMVVMLRETPECQTKEEAKE